MITSTKMLGVLFSIYDYDRYLQNGTMITVGATVKSTKTCSLNIHWVRGLSINRIRVRLSVFYVINRMIDQSGFKILKTLVMIDQDFEGKRYTFVLWEKFSSLKFRQRY